MEKIYSSSEMLAKIDEKLDPIINALTTLFGDEGNDIGDATSAVELIGNAVTIEHDSYEMIDFFKVISEIADIPICELYTFDDWHEEDFQARGAWG
jgi:hypothetical protein